jgi:outer membrane protein TolC
MNFGKIKYETRSRLHRRVSGRFVTRVAAVGTIGLSLAGTAVRAQNQTSPQNTTTPNTVGQSYPLGVTKLPTQPPPTGMQTPLPTPVQPVPAPDRPSTTSPKLEALAAQLAKQPLTINDAVAVALATNRQLALSSEALYLAEGRTSEARAGLNPTLGITSGPVFLANSLQPGAIAGATLPFDISGAIRAATSQLQFQEVATRLDINRTRNQIVSDVKSAFYSVLRAEALVGVATENLQNSLDRLSDANLRYQNRTVAYFDVVRAQTDVADAQKLVIQARNGVSLTTGELDSAMGIDVTTPLRVSDRNAVTEPPDVPPPTATPLTPESDVPPSGTGAGAVKPAPTPEAVQQNQTGLTAPHPDEIITQALTLGKEFQPLLNEALGTRPEILEADAEITAAQKGILYARRSLLPSLGLNFGYYYVRNSTGTRRINEPEAALTLSLPLYDGGLERARAQQARANVATAITNKRQAIDAVTLDVQQSYLNLVQARDQVAVANTALGQARTAFQLARVRYNAGVASRAGISPLLEVSDAQAALTLAEQNQVNALYDYNNARAQLDRSIGRFAYIMNGPGYNNVPPPSVVGTNKK